MKKQTYKNHIRYYYPHHFIFYPLICIAAVTSFLFIFRFNENALIWMAITGTFLTLAWLSFLVRQHYALMNQNRMVILELQFRYYVLTNQRLASRLSHEQLFALRFAPDDELPPLADRALKENLSGDDIKSSIKNWLPDLMRV